MIRRRALASKVWVRIFYVDSEGISVLVRLSTVRAVDFWQDDMLGFNMPHHVQSVEAGDDVRHIQEGPAVLHHLVEHVVPEQLEHVSVPRLCPGRVQVELRPVHDCTQLCE